MKKLFLILAVIFAVVSVSNAQLGTTVMNAGTTYAKVVSDYNITNTTAVYYQFKAGQHYPTTQDYVVNLDSISGNHTNVAVALYGQKSDLKGDWTAIGAAINWKGTTADTTIIISNSTANRYRNYKITFTGTGTGVTKIDTQELKLYLE